MKRVDKQAEKRSVSKRIIAIAMGIIFLLSLIPVLMIARYNHPAADDFAYGIYSFHAWQDTGSLWQAICMAFERLRLFYFTWQGTYAAIVMMALHPAVFGEGLYQMVPYLMIFSYGCSMLLFLKVVLRNYLGADRFDFWIISLALIGFCIQMLPSAPEGFFWYNGAVYYTFFYALSMVLFSLLLLYFKSKSRAIQITCLCLSIILAFLIGGGNYTTVLLTVILLLLFCLGRVLRKDRKWIAVLGVLLVCAGGLLVSMLAPGNAVRQAASGYETSALSAVGQSFYYAYVVFRRWTTWPLLLLFVFLCPFLYRIARHTRYRFRYPLVVFLFSFCLFAAGFTPPLYALGVYGVPNRLLNIQYFSYCLLVLLNLFYGLGWVSLRYKAYCRKRGWREDAIWDQWSKKLRKYSLFLLPVFTVVFAASVYLLPTLGQVTSVSAVGSLYSGLALDYDAQARARLVLLQEPGNLQVAVPEYTAKPYLLFFEDIEQDPSNWKNISMARYYKKDAVWLEPALQEGSQ